MIDTAPALEALEEMKIKYNSRNMISNTNELGR